MWPFFGLKMTSPTLIIMYHAMACRGVMCLCFSTSWVVEFKVLTTVIAECYHLRLISHSLEETHLCLPQMSVGFDRTAWCHIPEDSISVHS